MKNVPSMEMCTAKDSVEREMSISHSVISQTKKDTSHNVAVPIPR